MATVEFHVETSQHMLEHAGRELRAGDLLQASEKGWGAAAHAVKAIAEQRGWLHECHGHLYTAAQRISNELGQPRIMDLFRLASELHVNFYEGWLTHQAVERGLAQVSELLGLLESVSPSGRT